MLFVLFSACNLCLLAPFSTGYLTFSPISPNFLAIHAFCSLWKVHHEDMEGVSNIVKAQTCFGSWSLNGFLAPINNSYELLLLASFRWAQTFILQYVINIYIRNITSTSLESILNSSLICIKNVFNMPWIFLRYVLNISADMIFICQWPCKAWCICC